MKKVFSSLAIFPLLAAGLLVSSNNAQAGILVPPPPDSTGEFIPTPFSLPSGVNVRIRDNAPANIANYSGSCGAALDCGLFDFFPSNNDGVASPNDGDILFNGASVGNTFTGALGQSGKIKDLVLPFLGTGQLLNLSVPIPVASFIDLGTIGDGIDSFDLTTLTSIIFETTSSNSASALFSFDGFWNIEDGDGNLASYAGTVTLSTPISGSTAEEVVALASADVFVTNYSGQTTVEANVVGVPEPATLAGLAVIAGAAALTRKRAKK